MGLEEVRLTHLHIRRQRAPGADLAARAESLRRQETDLQPRTFARLQILE